jgi:hypothetical protein
MKNLYKLIGFIAIVAIIGFSMVACDNGDNTTTKKPVAKYKFSGSVPNSSRSLYNTQKNVAMAVSNVQGEDGFTDFYSKLGNKKAEFTPTMMKIAIGQLRVQNYNAGLQAKLIEEGSGNVAVIDLAQPIVTTADEIEPGYYNYLSFSFSDAFKYDPMDENYLTLVTFDKPNGFNLNTHAFKSPVMTGNGFGNHVIEENNKLTLPVMLLQPGFVNSYYKPLTDTNFSFDDFVHDGTMSLGCNVGSVVDIHMAGNTYGLFTGNVTTTLEDFVPGIGVSVGLGGDGYTGIVVPFEGITVPEDTTAVRFEVYWDIDGIIEQYEGPTNSTDDDIFVLKNGFWEAFSVKAFIEK